MQSTNWTTPPTPETVIELNWNIVTDHDMREVKALIIKHYVSPFNELMVEHRANMDVVDSILFERLNINIHKQRVIMQVFGIVSKNEMYDSLGKKEKALLGKHIENVKVWLV